MRICNAITIVSLCSAFVSGLRTSMQSNGVRSATQNIILYDGVCNFCNRWVDLLLKLDTRQKFTFSALQSESGMKMLEALGKDRNDISSVVYIRNLGDADAGIPAEAYFKSDAALKVTETLGAPSFAVSLLQGALPRSIRDGVYDGVANNRYNILGKREECRCSDNSAPDRFLSE